MGLLQQFFRRNIAAREGSLQFQLSLAIILIAMDKSLEFLHRHLKGIDKLAILQIVDKERQYLVRAVGVVQKQPVPALHELRFLNCPKQLQFREFKEPVIKTHTPDCYLLNEVSPAESYANRWTRQICLGKDIRRQLVHFQFYLLNWLFSILWHFKQDERRVPIHVYQIARYDQFLAASRADCAVQTAVEELLQAYGITCINHIGD